jgi:hypothetical protein
LFSPDDTRPMASIETSSRRSALAIVVLVALAAWLFIAHPAVRGQADHYSLLASLALLAAVCVLYVAEWLIHGLLPALVAGAVFLGAPRFEVDDTFTSLVLLNELIFIATLGLVLLIWSELGQTRFALLFWILAALGALVALTALAAEARHTGQLLAGNSLAEAGAPLQRVCQASAVFLIIGVLIGVWRAYRGRIGSRATRAAALGIALLVPAAAFGVASGVFSITLDDVLTGARWRAFPREVWQWLGQSRLLESVEARLWGPWWLVASSGALGLWRLVARGYRQRQKGEMPLAWPLALGLLTALPLFGPLASSGAALLTLRFFSVLLPVFGAADLLYLLGEELALGVPAATPAVPRA